MCNKVSQSGYHFSTKVPQFLFFWLLFFKINEAVPGKFPVDRLGTCGKFFKTCRTKTTIIQAFDLFQFVKRKINLIAPALGRSAAMKLLPAARTGR